jgi:hypothetical protein
MVDSQRRDQISDRLDEIETEHRVAVLYACESGSRARGFADSSRDSDYDVRFVYAHPRDWYLSLDLKRRDDTIDPPTTDEIDLHGWDLRKALQLFHDANPTLLEWLQSPIVYREDDAVLARWRDLISDYYTPRAAKPAYRGMARSIAEQNVAEAPIQYKAYLYVLRALLAVRWVAQGRAGRCTWSSGVSLTQRRSIPISGTPSIPSSTENVPVQNATPGRVFRKSTTSSRPSWSGRRALNFPSRPPKPASNRSTPSFAQCSIALDDAAKKQHLANIFLIAKISSP